jgi:multimeric flavodoxin WrbA
MKIVCVSASNIEMAKDRSASTHACEIVRDLALAAGAELHAPTLDIEIVRLVDYQLTPCSMCGECYPSHRCTRDPGFNAIFERLTAADAVFLVSPHYAPLPSKLVILFEKMEEMMYLHSAADAQYSFPLNRKPVGIIGHGGQTEASVSYYKTALLDPIATVLAAVQMQVVGANEKWPYGVAFGIEDSHTLPGSIFVRMDHDWEAVQERLRPLVYNVMQQACANFEGERHN